MRKTLTDSFEKKLLSQDYWFKKNDVFCNKIKKQFKFQFSRNFHLKPIRNKDYEKLQKSYYTKLLRGNPQSWNNPNIHKRLLV